MASKIFHNFNCQSFKNYRAPDLTVKPMYDSQSYCYHFQFQECLGEISAPGTSFGLRLSSEMISPGCFDDPYWVADSLKI